MTARNLIALPIFAVRHGVATLLGFAGELLTYAGNSLGTAARRLDGNF